MFAEVGLPFTGPPPSMRSFGKAQERMVTTCSTPGTPGMSWRVLCQEPTPPAAWAPCPWCQHWGVRHLVSGRSPPSFLLILNHPRVHMTTDESRSTQVAQMLSLPASARGSNAGGLGGSQEETAHTRPVGLPRTTRNDCWMARCPASHVMSPLVLSQGRPGPWGCCERQPGGDG